MVYLVNFIPIFVNLGERAQTALFPSIFIIIFNIKNKLVWLIMSSMLSLLSFQTLEKLDLEILDFWFLIELSILEWFFTWLFKYVLIPVRVYFQILTTLWLSSWQIVLVLNFQPAGGTLIKSNLVWY